jgi:hypothetical protein
MWFERAKRFRSLPSADRAELLRMVLRTTFFRILLILFGFKKARATASRTHRNSRPVPDALEVQRLARCARWAARSGLVRSPCLAASLALAWTLHRRGVETTLLLGVQRRAGALEAHAWLECDGKLLMDTSDGESFAPLVAFHLQ